MINYFNFQKMNDKFLITNDFGKYQFVNKETLNRLINNDIDSSMEEWKLLKENGFIIDGSIEKFIKLYTPWIQSMKGYCLSGTALHIFAVTNACNLDCVYCQAHDHHSTLDGMMSIEIGRKAIDFALQAPNKHITFEFQGGEPLLNFETVKDMILYSKKINKIKEIEYTIVTNLLNMTDDKLEFLVNNDVKICTSLDGNKIVHNHNRPCRNGNESYDTVLDKIKELQAKKININAIQTTTRFSLQYPKEIIDEYKNLNINNIFLRPLTPLGMANDFWDAVGYTPAEFMKFYKQGFEYIMEINKKGTKFIELHASYFLKKILHNYSDNYMELRSPCGASVGQMSYYYDGNIYTCDEGRMLSEMGDNSFKIGNVNTDTYSQAICSSVCSTVCKSSIIESIPKCSDCVYQPYCGVCPVVNYAGTNDLYASNKKDFRCTVYKGIIMVS